MSTRCQIKLRNAEDKIYIYKHADGYPSDVLPILVPFVKRFFKNRGFDECYLLCQIVRVFAARDRDEALKDASYELRRNKGDQFNCGQDYIGWGLDCCEHDDIEYLYEVDDKGNVFVNNKKVTTKNYKTMIKD